MAASAWGLGCPVGKNQSGSAPMADTTTGEVADDSGIDDPDVGVCANAPRLVSKASRATIWRERRFKAKCESGLMAIFRGMFGKRISVFFVGAICLQVATGAIADTVPASTAWTQDASSAAISHRGHPYTQLFSSPSPVPSGSKITAVRVQRHANRSGYLATTLCTAPAAGTCVSVQGSHVSTRVFNGLPANQPLYLTHTVIGEGPLAPPMFVRASVTVWYAIPALLP